MKLTSRIIACCSLLAVLGCNAAVAAYQLHEKLHDDDDDDAKDASPLPPPTPSRPIECNANAVCSTDCRHDCSSACDMQCTGAASCAFACRAGHAQIACRGSGPCTATVADGSVVECSGTGRCDVTCLGDCTVTCRTFAQCEVDCPPGRTCNVSLASDAGSDASSTLDAATEGG